MAKPAHDRSQPDSPVLAASYDSELDADPDRAAVIDPADEIDSAALAPVETIEGIWRDYELIVRNEDALYDGALTDANALRQSTTNQARDAFVAATVEADRLYAAAADGAEQARRAAVAAARTTRDRRIDDVLHSIGSTR
jgi:hypothetical protein